MKTKTEQIEFRSSNPSILSNAPQDSSPETSQNLSLLSNAYPLSIAPMINQTDRHFRYFMRGITRKTLLYTEMITTSAILHGDRSRLLGFSEIEKPLVLQLGGSDPKDLAECASIGEDYGYDQINLNVGCPSEKAEKGNFGACLMLQPDLTAECVASIRQAVSIPVSVKHRLGICSRDSLQADYDILSSFVNKVSQSGCRHYIVHARPAILGKISPRQNRIIPLLDHQMVYRLAAEFPHYRIETNGGITSLSSAQSHLENPSLQGLPSHQGKIRGIMIGRAAYENPFLFSQADQLFYGSDDPSPNRREVIEHVKSYPSSNALQTGSDLRVLLHRIQNLFKGLPGARFWRRTLSSHTQNYLSLHTILETACKGMSSSLMDFRDTEYSREAI